MSKQPQTEADKITKSLFGYLKDYRELKNMEEVELLNLIDDARSLMIECGAHWTQVGTGSQSEGYAIKTIMSVPPEWKLTNESREEVLEVFDFDRSTKGEHTIITPLLVFRKGNGHDPVCVYLWHINDTNIYTTKMAHIHDYLRSIKKNWR